jgi:hypothetical protein
MEVSNQPVFKTPIYVLRATRKYAKENREKINATRKKTTFIRRIKTILENEKMDDFEKHFKITFSKNYELFEKDEKVIELMKQINIEVN